MIRHCQTDDKRVGCAAHLQVGDNDDDDRQVTDKAEDGDDAEHDRDDDAYDRLVRQHGLDVVNEAGDVQQLSAAVRCRCCRRHSLN